MRFRKKVWGLKIIFLLFPPYNSPLQRNPFGFFDFLNFLKSQPTLLYVLQYILKFVSNSSFFIRPQGCISFQKSYIPLFVILVVIFLWDFCIHKLQFLIPERPVFYLIFSFNLQNDLLSAIFQDYSILFT